MAGNDPLGGRPHENRCGDKIFLPYGEKFGTNGARANPVQSSRPRIIVIPKKTTMGLQVIGNTADNAIQRGSSGKDRNISMPRWVRLSTQPP